jgi:hypothetical protein
LFVMERHATNYVAHSTGVEKDTCQPLASCPRITREATDANTFVEKIVARDRNEWRARQRVRARAPISLVNIDDRLGRAT